MYHHTQIVRSTLVSERDSKCIIASSHNEMNCCHATLPLLHPPNQILLVDCRRRSSRRISGTLTEALTLYQPASETSIVSPPERMSWPSDVQVKSISASARSTSLVSRTAPWPILSHETFRSSIRSTRPESARYSDSRQTGQKAGKINVRLSIKQRTGCSLAGKSEETYRSTSHPA
jgi:hypothetical protein